MERLAKENRNTGSEYDRIFEERSWRKADPQDLKRWNLLSKYFKGGSLIDLGCLDSMIPYLMKLKYPHSEIWGLDQTEEAIKKLKEQFEMVNYIVGDVYKTKFPSEYFNYVVMGELLEHLEKPDHAITEALRILKPKGILAISVPYKESVEPGAVDKDHHLWSFDKSDFTNLLHIHGSLRYKVFGSKYFPYQYHFPTLIIWCKKYEQMGSSLCGISTKLQTSQ